MFDSAVSDDDTCIPKPATTVAADVRDTIEPLVMLPAATSGIPRFCGKADIAPVSNATPDCGIRGQTHAHVAHTTRDIHRMTDTLHARAAANSSTAHQRTQLQRTKFRPATLKPPSTFSCPPTLRPALVRTCVVFVSDSVLPLANAMRESGCCTHDTRTPASGATAAGSHRHYRSTPPRGADEQPRHTHT
jgi:hypothetical protein